MIRDEVITLCEYVAHACPQQRFDKYTPNVWADILAGQGLTFDECRAAVIAIKRRQPFVDTSEIVAEVKRARRDQRERQEAGQLRAAEAERLALTAGRGSQRETLPAPVHISAEARSIFDRIRNRRTATP